MGQGVPCTQRKGPLAARESPLREAAHYAREQSSHRGQHWLSRLGAWSPEQPFSFCWSTDVGTQERPEPHPATCSSPGLCFLIWLGASTGRVCGLQLSARAPESPRPRRLPQRSPPMMPAGPRRHRPLVGSASSGARRCPAAQHTAGSGWTAPLWGDGVPVDVGQRRACLGPLAPSTQGSLWQQLRDPARPPHGLCFFPGLSCEYTHSCWVVPGAEPPASRPGPPLADQGGQPRLRTGP